jgi:hypothetical protein
LRWQSVNKTSLLQMKFGYLVLLPEPIWVLRAEKTVRLVW